MGHHAIFVTRRNGCDRYFRDRYAGQDVISSLLFGLEGAIDLIEWGTEVENTGNPANDNSAEGGLLLDYDSQVSMFYGCQLFLDDTELIPYLIDLLKITKWKDWDVRWAKWGMLSISEYLGFTPASICKKLPNLSDKTKETWSDWWLEFDAQYTETLVTHKDSNGNLSNYTTGHNLEDILPVGENIIKQLIIRQTSLLPNEKDINNCLYIDEINKTIHIFWGYPLCDNSLLIELKLYWSGWQVKWIDEGYAGHLKLINCERNDLLISEKEAMNSVIKVFKKPIEYRIKCQREESESTNTERIVSLQNYLQSLEQLKQEWFDKVAYN